MDQQLLLLLNQQLAHPLLDVVMIVITYAGLAALPTLGLALIVSNPHRKAGYAILGGITLALLLALTFQFLAMRPRPEFARHVIPLPGLPGYPSGHAAVAFSTALVLSLSYRRPLVIVTSLAAAALISLSRVYLGVHYPTDIMGGAILGSAAGAAAYGLLFKSQSGRIAWGWFVWVQGGIALVITQMAYLSILPAHLIDWPYADKVMHFILIGTAAFWLNLLLRGKRIGWGIPLAIAIPLALAGAEEAAQMLSPIRSASFSDLTMDILGLIFFWWLSEQLLPDEERAIGPPPQPSLM